MVKVCFSIAAVLHGTSFPDIELLAHARLEPHHHAKVRSCARYTMKKPNSFSDHPTAHSETHQRG